MEEKAALEGALTPTSAGGRVCGAGGRFFRGAPKIV